MTREEKIEEAAQKYVGFIGVGDKISLKDAFKIGEEWALANQWHSVADGDLPTQDGEYLVLVSDVPEFFRYNVESNFWSKSRANFYKYWCSQKTLLIGWRFRNYQRKEEENERLATKQSTPY